jgi:uncharacterized protein YdeI (YjbR/CyaY-like superfamily)
MTNSTEDIEITTRAALRDWLAAHHGRQTGIWCVTYKKAAGPLHLPYPEVVQECLAWGWIDSLSRKRDDMRSMLWIAPRRPGSGWSRVNKAHIARLEAQGLLAPPGRAAIVRAKGDGSWTALDDVENGTIPPDLASAFAATPGTRAIWDAWPRSVTRGALEILLGAKRPETRAAKVAAIIDSARRGDRPFQWAGRKAKS